MMMQFTHACDCHVMAYNIIVIRSEEIHTGFLADSWYTCQTWRLSCTVVSTYLSLLHVQIESMTSTCTVQRQLQYMYMLPLFLTIRIREIMHTTLSTQKQCFESDIILHNRQILGTLHIRAQLVMAGFYIQQIYTGRAPPPKLLQTESTITRKKVVFVSQEMCRKFCSMGQNFLQFQSGKCT